MRKGQGLNAIINEVAMEKNRLLDQSDAALLRTSAPPQQADLLPEVSLGTDNCDRIPSAVADLAKALLEIPSQVNTVSNSLPEAGNLLPSVANVKPPKKRRSRAANGVAPAPAAAVSGNAGLSALPADGKFTEMEPVAQISTKAGKPRKRASKAKAVPAVKAEVKSESAPTENVQAVLTANEPASEAKVPADGDLGFGFTKRGKPRKRAAPKPKAVTAVKVEAETGSTGAGTIDDPALQAVKAPKRRKAKVAKLEDEVKIDGVEAAEAEQPKKKRRRGPDPNAFREYFVFRFGQLWNLVMIVL